MQNHSRRGVLTSFAALALPSRFAIARDQSPLKLVFPFSPGGSADAIARLFAEQLQARLDRAVIVDNRAGAGGRIGAQAVKNAARDDEALLFASASQISLQPHLFLNLGYDPFVDFAPISQVVTVDLALAVSGQLPVRSIAELIDWMQADPARAVYGSPGTGTAPHFICTEFGSITGLNLRHTAYRGTPAALADVMAGRVPMYMAFLSELLESLGRSQAVARRHRDDPRDPQGRRSARHLDPRPSRDRPQGARELPEPGAALVVEPQQVVLGQADFC